MRPSLLAWCKRNSRRPTTFTHLCTKPLKITRGKKINITTSEFLDRLDELAMPNPDISVEHNRSETEMDHVKKSALKYRASKRIKLISLPVAKYSLLPRDFMRISRRALLHKTTDREEKLSTPAKHHNTHTRDFTRVKRAALKYKATPRIEEISVPPKYKISKKYKPREPVYVKKAALSAEPSPRTLEISQPRDRSDKVSRKHPFDVCKGALTYEATPRTEAMAKPNRITPKYVNPEDKWRHRFDREPAPEQGDAKDSKKDKKK